MVADTGAREFVLGVKGFEQGIELLFAQIGILSTQLLDVFEDLVVPQAPPAVFGRGGVGGRSARGFLSGLPPKQGAATHLERFTGGLHTMFAPKGENPLSLFRAGMFHPNSQP